MLPYYRFALKKDKVNHYAVVNTRNVITQMAPYFVTEGPIGWADTEIAFGRNLTYFGMLRSYSTPYKFVKDGAVILRHIFYNEGGEGVCRLYIEKLNRTTGRYEFFFEGDLDFSTAVSERDFIQINIKEAGISAMLKANEDIEYEIPISDADAVTIDIPSFKLKGKADWLVIYPPYDDRYDNNSPVEFYMELFDSICIGTPITPSVNTFSATQIFTANQIIYDVNIKGQIDYYIKNNTSGGLAQDIDYAVELEIDGNIIGLASFTLGAGQDTSRTITFNEDVLSISSGGKVYLRITSSGPGNTPTNQNEIFVWQPGQKIQLSYYYYTTPFTVKGIRYYRLLELLINRLTDNTAVLDSPFLKDRNASLLSPAGFDNRPFDTIVVSGDSIRNIIDTSIGSPKIKTTFKDAFRAAAIAWHLGLSVKENQVTIKERQEYFNKDNIIADLGEVASFTISHLTDLYYNKVEIGYLDRSYDDLNGRDEFNTKQVYSMPLTRVYKDNAVLDYVSPYRADMYGIFYTWAQYYLLDTNDSTSDNDVFMIEIGNIINGAGHYQPLARANAGLVGLVDPLHAFNFGLSPKRCLLRNGGFFHSLTYNKEEEYIRFQTSAKNSKLITTIFTDMVKEGADVQIKNLRNRYFKPFVLSIETATNANTLQALIANPEGCFTGTIQGVRFKGFPFDVKIRPQKPIKEAMVLWVTPDTDLTQLPLL